MANFLPAPIGLALSVAFVSGLPVVTATFSSVSGALGYRLSAHPASQLYAGGFTRTDQFSGTSKALRGLTAGQDWFVRVYAISSDGKAGMVSRRVRITIPAAPIEEPEDSPDPPPAPEPGDPIEPPLNLRASAVSGQDACWLYWDTRPGTVKYRLYRAENIELIATIDAPTTQFLLQGNDWWTGGTKYFVTAEGSNEMESMPSADVFAASGKSYWNDPNTPDTPTNLVAYPEWNNGAPQNLIEWDCGNAMLYDVYRNGVMIATGINSRLYYIDLSVTPGVTYSYQVRSLKVFGNPGSAAQYRVSGLSAAVNCATRTGQPAAQSNTLSVSAGENGPRFAVIQITPFPGARDYRAYPQGVAPYEGSKYAGRGSTAIQVNGLPNGTPTTYVVEALDKWGPFQRHESMDFPGHHDLLHVNGQGDPGNVPSVLASTTIALQGAAITLTGAQQFKPDFGAYPYGANLSGDSVPASIAAAHNVAYPVPSNHSLLRRLQNPDFRIDLLRNDMTVTPGRIFAKGAHFMWLSADGGTATKTEGVRHNNNATLGLLPKQVFTLSGSQVLRILWRIDAHCSSRRWINLTLKASSDTWHLRDDEFFSRPTTSNSWIRLHTDHGRNILNWAAGEVISARSAEMNGTQAKLDFGTNFEILLRFSDKRCQVRESGVVRIDTTLSGLVMSLASLEMALDHQVYHTAEDRNDHHRNGCFERYWTSFRILEDERHLNYFYAEVLSAWPT